MSKTTNAVTTQADAETLARLSAQYPQEAGFARMMLPRITFKSQDVLEGKGKDKKVVIEAGTFFTEKATDEKDKDGKTIFEKEEIGLEMQGIIVFQRKQLRFYDEPNEQFYSTPIYDSNEDVLPLFCGKNKVATGTPAELKKSFEFTTPEGKKRSKLEDNVVVYVWYEGELYQMSLRGSSMYSFKDYTRNIVPPTVLTHFYSEAQEKGTIEWNQMQFGSERTITADEAQIVGEQQALIQEAVATEKAFYAGQAQDDTVTAAVLALPGAADDDF